MKCCVGGCNNEAIIRNEEEKFLCSCTEHIEMVRDHFEEEHNRRQQEMYEDWVRSQI